jgi:hypothetical protein
VRRIRTRGEEPSNQGGETMRPRNGETSDRWWCRTLLPP